MGFLSGIGKIVKKVVTAPVKAVAEAAKVVSTKNIIGVVTGQKSLGSIATEAGNRAVKGAVAAVTTTTKGVSITPAATLPANVPIIGTIPSAATIKTASPATPKKAVAKEGILNSGISLGSDKVDKIVSGVLSGGLAAAINNDDGTKKLAGAVGGAVAQTWLDKNWPYLAGAGAALLLLFRGRRK